MVQCSELIIYLSLLGAHNIGESKSDKCFVLTWYYCYAKLNFLNKEPADSMLISTVLYTRMKVSEGITNTTNQELERRVELLTLKEDLSCTFCLLRYPMEMAAFNTGVT